MPRCEHQDARYHITMGHELDAQIHTSEIYDDVSTFGEYISAIKIEVRCDCGYSANFNAWLNSPFSSADRWPRWLLNRLIALRAHNASVHLACTSCHVPPADHPSWK